MVAVVFAGMELQGGTLLAAEVHSLAAAPGDQGKKDENSGADKQNNGTDKKESASGTTPSGNSSPDGTPTAGTSSSPGNGRNDRAEATPALPVPWPSVTPAAGGNPAPQGMHREVGVCHNSGGNFHFISVDDNSSLYRGHLGHPGDQFNVEEDYCLSLNDVVHPTAVVPAAIATATPTGDALTPTTTATAIPTGEVPTPVPGSPSPTAESNTPPGQGNSTDNRNDGDNGDDGNGNQPGGQRSGGVLGAEGVGADSPEVLGEAGAGVESQGQGGVLSPGLLPGEVLGGLPGSPRYMSGQTGTVPSVSRSTAPGAPVAQIPQVASDAPRVLPTTGEADRPAYQGWGLVGLALSLIGLTLLRMGQGVSAE